jgi:hypothetical protein
MFACGPIASTELRIDRRETFTLEHHNESLPLIQPSGPEHFAGNLRFGEIERNDATHL